MCAQPGKPLSLLEWGATRWNTKVDAMQTVLKLSTAINYVMVQKTYRLNDEELRSMERAIAFLTTFCAATDKSQKDDVTLVDAFRQLRQLQAHFSELFRRPRPAAGMCGCVEVHRASPESRASPALRQLLRLCLIPKNVQTY